MFFLADLLQRTCACGIVIDCVPYVPACCQNKHNCIVDAADQGMQKLSLQQAILLQ